LWNGRRLRHHHRPRGRRDCPRGYRPCDLGSLSADQSASAGPDHHCAHAVPAARRHRQHSQAQARIPSLYRLKEPAMSSLVIQGILNGLILGALYGLIGIGLNIIYGVLRVVNFAHGEFLVLGAYCAWVLFTYLGISPLLSIPVTFLIFFAVSYLLYFVLIPRMSKSDDPETSSLLLMFGVSIALSATMLLIFDADARSLTVDIDPVFLTFGDIILPTVRLLALGIALVLVCILSYFLYKTQIGKALRAIIMNRDAVNIVGINAERLSAVAFGLGIGI